MLDAEDITKLDAQFGTGVLKSPQLRVSRNYGNKLDIAFDSDEATAVKNVKCYCEPRPAVMRCCSAATLDRVLLSAEAIWLGNIMQRQSVGDSRLL